MKQGRVILEVITSSVADAVAAERGGATRLEIVSRLDVGGLTPPLALVGEIRASVRIPVRVMLRETEGFAVTDERERQRLCRLAQEIAETGVEGLVFGFLENGEADVELARRLLSQAPTLRATFHRAFEEVNDSRRAIEHLKAVPQIDCILTSGGAGSWADKSETLLTLTEQAAPEIALLVGGGLDLDAVTFFSHTTPIRAFHLGRAVRQPATVSGEVCTAKVREFAQTIG